MVKIKSFSVGNGDMFYIDHSSDNFTIIDCNLPTFNATRKKNYIDELKALSQRNGITRFISTHGDQDHIHGLKEIDEAINIVNFYTVKNEATKDDPTTDFNHYCKLRDDTSKAFYLERNIIRKWMNEGNDERGSAGLRIQWPILTNEYFLDEQENAKNGLTPNNLSPIITYHLENGATFAWMGDLETEFMDNVVAEKITLPEVDVLFAPHHGRKTGTVPDVWLNLLNPKIIVLGEAPVEHLAEYPGYNLIKQNYTGNINFYLGTGTLDIFVENPQYSVSFLNDNYLDNDEDEEFYIGSLDIPFN